MEGGGGGGWWGGGEGGAAEGLGMEGIAERVSQPKCDQGANRESSDTSGRDNISYLRAQILSHRDLGYMTQIQSGERRYRAGHVQQGAVAFGPARPQKGTR